MQSNRKNEEASGGASSTRIAQAAPQSLAAMDSGRAATVRTALLEMQKVLREPWEQREPA